MTSVDFGSSTRRASTPVKPAPPPPPQMSKREARALAHDWLAARLGALEAVDTHVTAPPSRRRPQAPPPPHRELLRQSAVQQRLVGVSRTALRTRRDVRREVAGELDRIVREASNGHYDDWRQRVAVVETQWRALAENDPEVVEREAARAVSAFGLPSEVAVLGQLSTDRFAVRASVSMPGPEALLGERAPSLTRSGAKSTKSWTKTDRNDAWVRICWAHMAAVAADVLTRCPGLSDVEVVAFVELDGENGPVGRVMLARDVALDERGRPRRGTELAELAQRGVVDGEVATTGRTNRPNHLDGTLWEAPA